MLAELVPYAVGPPETSQREEERHEEVSQDGVQRPVLPVAPVGDVDLLVDDAEPAAPGEPANQLYVVELEAGIEAPASR